MINRSSIWLSLIAILCFAYQPGITEIKSKMNVGTFPQEISHIFTTQDNLPSNKIICTAHIGEIVYAGTEKGLAVYDGQKWSCVAELPNEKVVSLFVDSGDLYILYEKTIHIIKSDQTKKIIDSVPPSPSSISVFHSLIFIGTKNGLFSCVDKQWQPDSGFQTVAEDSPNINAIAFNKEGTMTVAAESGLFQKKSEGKWKPVFPADDKGQRWAPQHVKGVLFDDNDRFWFASPQGTGCYEESWTLYTGKEGLPYNDFTCMCTGADGSIWYGTSKGAVRFGEGDWSYRQGLLWLPDDHVNGMTVMKNGDAWIATDTGIALIERHPMTLAEKAEFYEDEMQRYIKRTEYGYVSEVNLEKPGDKSKIIYSDSDNDGLWTAMYGAGECFGYAATKDPEIKKRAKQAFEALRFLSVVAIGSDVNHQSGFVARTVLPTTEPDPNLRESYTLEGMKADQKNSDPYWKVYSPRWPKSKDGKYWFKTDTSSDELDGHFFFYPLYYDLVVDTPEEKERVRDVVRTIIDHLIRNDFCLVDHDGKPTRWGVYGPSALNHEIRWAVQRGMNSLSILSYLSVAGHVTGDQKYAKISRALIDNHSYGMNVVFPSIQTGIGSGNQSDNEMAFMNFYNILHYSKDEELKKHLQFIFYNYWILEFPEMNPFFNFAYASCGLGKEYKDTWGVYDVSPWSGWLDDSVKTLKGLPLDRSNWAHDNDQRLDIIPLPIQSEIDSGYKLSKRGYRVNHKVIPVEECHFNHWNHDPWRLNSGGDGRTLASGAVFLLPYYMGLYHGFIE